MMPFGDAKKVTRQIMQALRNWPGRGAASPAATEARGGA